MMKHKLILGTALLALAATSQAATVTTGPIAVGGAFSANGIVTSASLTDLTVTVGGTEFEYDLVFTGLVGDGSGGTTSGVRAGNGTSSILMSVGGNNNTATQQLDLAIANVSVLSGTLDASALTFDGLTALTISNVNQPGKNLTAGTTTLTGVLADGTYAVAGLGKSVTTTGGVNGRVDGVTLQFTAVPEPSAAALLGLGGITLMLRRKK